MKKIGIHNLATQFGILNLSKFLQLQQFHSQTYTMWVKAFKAVQFKTPLSYTIFPRNFIFLVVKYDQNNLNADFKAW